MGWLLISFFCIAICMGLIHYNYRKPFKQWKDDENYQVGFFVSTFFSLIVVAAIGGIYAGAHEGHGQDNFAGCTVHTNTWNIVSAVRDTTVTSSFILGTGGTHTVDRYYVYREDPQGLMLTEYNANKTYVVEQEGQPQYTRIDHICPMPVYDFLWWSSGNTRHNYGKTGTLYVPPGTVLREFRM